MAAKLTIGLDTRSEKNGFSPIRLRIYNAGKTAYIYPGVYCQEKDFTGDLHAPIKKRALCASVHNEKVRACVAKFEEVTFELERNGMLNGMPPSELRDYIVAKKQVKRKEIKKARIGDKHDFLEYFSNYGKSRRSEGSVRQCDYVWNILAEYANHLNQHTIHFQDITYRFLVDLKKYLRSTGRGEDARYKVESYIRAAYREGMREGLVTRNDDPFFSYKIEKVPEKDIETLSVETIQRLLSLDLTNQQGYDSLERTRNILLASFCLCGANLMDIYNIPVMHSQETVFVRHKVNHITNRPVHIYIEPELQNIVSQYRGEKYMFMFQERYQSYTSFQRKMNERCKRLSELLGEKVNMQLIRRSYATISAELDVPELIIDKGMGHTDQTVMRKYYAKFDWSKLKNANRKVLDHVMAGVVPNSIKVPKLIQRKSAAE